MIKRLKFLIKFIFLLALAVFCAWTLIYGMPALEKLTPSKTIPASTATLAPASVLATSPEPSHTASMIPPTSASINRAVVWAWSLKVYEAPDAGSEDPVVAWFISGQVVFIDQCQHGWAKLASQDQWVNSYWLDPNVCGGMP